MLASLIVGKSSRHDKESGNTYEIRVSIEVSIGFVLRHLRNDPRPGVRANEEDGMRKWDVGRKSTRCQRGFGDRSMQCRVIDIPSFRSRSHRVCK